MTSLKHVSLLTKKEPIRCVWILSISSVSQEGYELIMQPRGCGFCLQHLPGFLAQPFFMKLSEQLCLFLLVRLLLSDSSRGRNIDSCLTILENMLQYPATATRWLRSSPELLRVSAHWELKRAGGYRATCLNAINTPFHHIMTIFCILLSHIFAFITRFSYI